MALGSVGAAVAGGVASAGASRLLSGIGGSGPSMPSFGPALTDIRSPGLGVTSRGIGDGVTRIGVNRNPILVDALGRVRSLADEQSSDLTDILGLVRPGFSKIRDARLARIEDARNRSVSNLSENLQRRRVLGSSFAQDALARADAEFGRAAADAEAQSFLEELDVTNRLLEQRFQTNLEGIMTEINQANFEADLAARLSGAASSALTANNQINASLAQTRAQLAAQGAAGAGRFFQPTVDAIGDAISRWAEGGFQISGGPALTTGDFAGAFNPANAGFL